MTYHTFSQNHQVDVLITNAAQSSLSTSWIQPFATSTDIKADRIVFFLLIGAAAGNVDMELLQATSSGGAGSKAITGAEITTITTSTDEVLVSIEIGPNALDNVNGFTWVQAAVTVASGTPVYSVFYIKHELRNAGLHAQGDNYTEQVEVLG